MIKLDSRAATHIITAMANSDGRTLNSDLVKKGLTAAGMTQKDIAKELGVTAQAVTNWLKGKDFPRPPKLLKLAIILNLTTDELVESASNTRPIVAFRKKGSARTTDQHIRMAEHIGMLLRPLTRFLPQQSVFRSVISSSADDVGSIGNAANQTRKRLGIGSKSTVKYSDLIGEFANSGAVLVPVLWGQQEKHKNALHIHLPAEDVTFIFLNLDTRIEDFKFWMAHELAHVYTPHLAGKEEGEDFADAFAGSLLFSSALAKQAYKQLSALDATSAKAAALLEIAEKQKISVFTVYSQIQKYAKKSDLPELSVNNTTIHKMRNTGTSTLISESLFNGKTPTVAKYIMLCEDKFATNFFDALRSMIKESEVGAGYLKQILSISHAEAKELHQALM